MNVKIIAGTTTLLTVGALAWAAKDGSVMTVNGVDVPRSEFEYLYHKNSQQQDGVQVDNGGLDEYVSLFELYKMKVADAKAAGIDTTAAYIAEMKQYSRELAAPYVADSVFLNKLIDEAYAHSRIEAEANHIMLSKGKNAEENAASLQLADSIRTALLNGADFDELAKKYSIDRSAVNNGGHMGYIAAGRYPYAFEEAVYTLEPGEISGIVESAVGYHIIKGGNKRPSKGSVQASHIMKMVRPGSSAEVEAKAKAEIDSLYDMLMDDPSMFSNLAQTSSEDPGSARMGGMLGWFVTGQMVPEFSEAAFALNKGEISKPVRSAYGWHIIKKNDEKGPESRDEIKATLLQRLNDPRGDVERYTMVRDNRIANLAKKHKATENGAVKSKMTDYIASHGMDSVFFSTFGNSGEPIYVIEGMATPVADFVAALGANEVTDPYLAGKLFDERYTTIYDDALMTAEEGWLDRNVADYHNLLNEYKEGSLLYEVSKHKVWDKASQDTEGLQRYFENHRGDYTWSEPKAKGILIQAKDDSIADLVKARYAEIKGDSAIQIIRKEFRNQAIADKVLASKGVNKIVDFLMFGGPEAEPSAKYPVYFMLDSKVIYAPEEASDVKGQVTADYQNQLEAEWVADMRSRYPVVLNKKELKKVK